jgi:hypothetical protein
VLVLAVLQVLELRHGADLLVATPGRLLELLAKKTVSLARLKLLVRHCLAAYVIVGVSSHDESAICYLLSYHSQPGKAGGE